VAGDLLIPSQQDTGAVSLPDYTTFHSDIARESKTEELWKKENQVAKPRS